MSCCATPSPRDTLGNTVPAVACSPPSPLCPLPKNPSFTSQFCRGGQGHPALRLFTKPCNLISESRMANRVYTGGLQLFDDTLVRLFPKDWARLLKVAFEKRSETSQEMGPRFPRPTAYEDPCLRTSIS